MIRSPATGDLAGSVVEDRLGSDVTTNGDHRKSYYPYGELKPGMWPVDPQFATYRRDSATQFDYAQQRYYSSKIARFLTPDPWGGSAGPGEPQSFNRYAYVQGDPINHFDSTGLGPEDLGKDDGGDWGKHCELNGIYCGTGTATPLPCVSAFCVAPDASSGVNPQHSCMVAVMQAFRDNPISLGYGSLRAFETCSALPTSVSSYGGPGGGGSGSGGGSGGAGPAVGYGGFRYYGLSSEGPKYDLVKARIDEMNRRLNNDPDCLNWLLSGSRGGYAELSLRSTLAQDTRVAGSIEKNGVNMPGITATAVDLPGILIVINGQGGFFYGDPSVNDQVHTLLHELAHVTGAPGFLPGDEDAGVQASNENALKDNCGKTISP
jgi:RHS repeat-associated protein